MDNDELKATLLKIERRGWDSLCDSTGGNFYGGLMTADALMVLANGAVMDRKAVVESLEHAPSMADTQHQRRPSYPQRLGQRRLGLSRDRLPGGRGAGLHRRHVERLPARRRWLAPRALPADATSANRLILRPAR